MQTQQISQRHRNCLLYQCCFWSYHLIVFSLGLAIMSMIIKTFTINEKILISAQYKHSLQTIELWKKGYIIDIKSVNTNNCPQGYEPLLEYKWPGTQKGCYCLINSNNYTIHYILNGVCTSELINQGCTQITQLGQQKLHLWKGQKLLCQKRAQSFNFYDSTIQSNNIKKCSQNKSYQLNILSNLSCPISQISNLSLPGSGTSLLLDIKHNQKLNYINQNGYPIADFKVTQYQFCQFLNQINISPNKIGNYKLELNTYQTCKGKDIRYVEFDNMNQQQFYTNNTRVYDKISQLPGYPRPSANYHFKLGYIKYPEWTYSCRVSSGHNLYRTTQQLLYSQQNYLIYTLISVSIPCIIIFCLLFRIFFILRHLLKIKKKMRYNAIFLTQQQIQQQLPSLNIKESRIKQLIIFIIQEILRLTVLILVIITLLCLLNSSIWIKQAFKNKCTQKYIENILRFYQHQIDQITQYLIQILFVFVVLIIADIIYFIIRFKYTDLQQNKKQQQIQKQSDEEQLKAQHKQLDYRPEQSSQVILDKQHKQFKINQLDDIMDNNVQYGQTKDNFYADIDQNQYNLVTTNKKKKRKINNKKKKNLFKDNL